MRLCEPRGSRSSRRLRFAPAAATNPSRSSLSQSGGPHRPRRFSEVEIVRGGAGRLRRPGRAACSARARQGLLRHQLARGSRARRLLPGGRRRHLRQIRARGEDRSGRAAGQQSPAADFRQGRLLHGRQHDPGDGRGEGGRADARRRLHVPEGPDHLHVPSGPGPRQDRGPEERQRLFRRQGQSGHRLPVGEADLRFQGREGEAVFLQPGALSRR